MKGFAISLLSVIFLVLLAGSVQSVATDHLELGGKGIFKNEEQVNLISSKDSKYEIFVLVEIRNAQGELISISESMRGNHISYEVADIVFNEYFGKKEIITFDNVKYEKRQFVEQLISEEYITYSGTWLIYSCGDIGVHLDVCPPIFQANGPAMYVDKGDVMKNHWTVLRELN